MEKTISKIAVISDVHIDLNVWKWECLASARLQTDVLCVAGDISNDIWETCHWLVKAKEMFPTVIWVAGNHDFYNIGFHQTRLRDPEHVKTWPYPSFVKEIVEHYRRWCNEYGIIFLHRSAVDIGGITFIGATGWHDYVAGEPYSTDDQIAAWYKMLGDTQVRWHERQLAPDHTAPVIAGHQDYLFLKNKVEQSSGPVVVITHHIPHRKYAHQKPDNLVWTLLHGSFVNTMLESVSNQNIRYWIFGHTHHQVLDNHNEYTTYVCNPKGYPGENPQWKPIILDL